MEETGIFAAIAAISPWWWVAFALGLGALEMATMSFFLIWPALAALIMAGLVALVPGLSGEVIVSIFAILAIALTFAGRSLLHRFGDGQPQSNLNSRSAQLVGRHAKVLDWGETRGSVEVDGIRWAATCDAPLAEGASVRITEANGMTLTVTAG